MCSIGCQVKNWAWFKNNAGRMKEGRKEGRRKEGGRKKLKPVSSLPPSD